MITNNPVYKQLKVFWLPKELLKIDAVLFGSFIIITEIMRIFIVESIHLPTANTEKTVIDNIMTIINLCVIIVAANFFILVSIMFFTPSTSPHPVRIQFSVKRYLFLLLVMVILTIGFYELFMATKINLTVLEHGALLATLLVANILLSLLFIAIQYYGKQLEKHKRLYWVPEFQPKKDKEPS